MVGAWLELNYETLILAGIPFFFIVFFLLERTYTDYPLQAKKGLRWLSNFCFYVFSIVILYVLFPILPLGFAVAIKDEWGLFNHLSLPFFIEITASFLILDLVMYGQHRLLHKVPLLWRVHKVHHSDMDFDCTTGFRFHPLEVVFTVACQMAAVLMFGLTPLSLIIFNLLHIPYAYFSHLNVKLVDALESVLSFFIITPKLHRIHHSVNMLDSNANYSTFLTCWDFLFKTLTTESKGESPVKCGIAELVNHDETYLDTVLLLPFKKTKG
ncbi:MAG: hypothetical protein COB62_02240 [Piscirickettsiaceae bacterium]|nr:MAG: hypothetical protein COB62_02240 [Piscirickettsiaceae bacterium]